jgi:sortase (surface protein transpeptidase)
VTQTTDTAQERRGRNLPAALLAVLGVLLVLGGLWLRGSGDPELSLPPEAVGEEQPPELVEQPAPAEPVEEAQDPPEWDQEQPLPVRIRVPDLGVDGPIIELGLDADDWLEVPQTAHETGFWTGGYWPGERGPAVLAGHVDWKGKRGVFWDLRHIQPGAEVEVEREDGSVVRYRIDKVEQHAKAEFPTETVYHRTELPEIRLVTCGGAFNQNIREYEDNIIAFGTIIQD